MAHLKNVSVAEYNAGIPSTMQVPDDAAATCQTYYYRQRVTKEECELLLRRKPIGTFIARDSSTFVGGFCVMMRVNENGTTVTRSYLLEKVPAGVHLRLTEEDVFPTLYQFIYAHTKEKMVLPSRLTLPTSDWLATIDPALSTKTIIVSSGPMLPPKPDDLPFRPPKADASRGRLPPTPGESGPPARPPKGGAPDHGRSSSSSDSLPPRPPKGGGSTEPFPPRPPKSPGPALPPPIPDSAEPLPRRPPKSPGPGLPPPIPDSAEPLPARPPKTGGSSFPPPKPKDRVVVNSSFEVDEVECELYYYGCMDTWADSHTECIFQTYLELVEIRDVVPNKVTFKMGGQSITIEDKGSKQFIRRHYQIKSILHFDLDPDQRTCKVKKEKKPLSVFGMVIRKPGQDKNLCHLFASQHVAASGVIDAVQAAIDMICGAGT
ncbi:tensin homolog [Sycon ciliatum]|uniref:tensin homolog n=1 Tax=Sycon ciliatum TaxID=27933 RepID=UPI0020AC0499|eukprot:scpid77795/ scgid28587/ Tensin-4